MRNVWIIPLTAILLGCASELETGYKPRPLIASEAERRSYYAAPFTPEQRAAAMEQRQQNEVRRPSPRF